MISQVLTIVVVILDDLIFTRAQKYLAIDWLALDGQTDEADAKKIEEYYRYDERKEKRLSVVLAAVAVAGAAAAYYFGHQLMTAMALLLAALMANQHRVGRAVARKTLVRSIKCAFPGWLMDIVLLCRVKMFRSLCRNHRSMFRRCCGGIWIYWLVSWKWNRSPCFPTIGF